MQMKKYILHNISNLPNNLNYWLLQINLRPKLIYGSKYKIYREKLRTQLDYSNESALLNILNYAIENIPYYHKLYNKKIVNINDYQNNIGFIDKEIIMNNHNDFISKTFDLNQYEYVTTAGTSGKPLKILVPKNRYIVELGTMHHIWKRVGYDFQIKGVIRNHIFAKNKDYIINPITKEFIFNNFKLDQEYMLKIYKIIRKNKIRYLHAYPSAAFQFSTFLYENKLDVSFIKAFLSGSENIYEYQRKLIENKLNIRFFNWYGHSEKLILGGYCEHSNLYHIEPTYGYFELIDKNGNPINKAGNIGEIVGSTINNFGMPLIRYKTGDYAEYVGDRCPYCKRKMPIIKNIMGRWSGEKIYNLDSTFVTTTALNLHDDLYSVINGLQYIQKEVGKLDILIIKSIEYTSEHERRLMFHFKTKLKKGCEINIHYVDKLIYQKNGKFLLLISKIK